MHFTLMNTVYLSYNLYIYYKYLETLDTCKTMLPHALWSYIGQLCFPVIPTDFFLSLKLDSLVSCILEEIKIRNKNIRKNCSTKQTDMQCANNQV